MSVQSQGLHAKGYCVACDEIRARQAAGELIIICDISVSGGYTGNLEVSIPVNAMYNGQTVTILHCRNGILESINVTVSNGMARGIFSSLSPFAVAQARSISLPRTGDVSNPRAVLLLALALLCSVAALVHYRNRKAR